MVEHHDTLNPSENNLVSRRAALQGTAALGALALPAGAALATEAPALLGGTDPHVAWWAERAPLVAEIAALDKAGGSDAEVDPLFTRQCDLEELIVTTPPTTAEGLAIVAAASLSFHDFDARPEVDGAGAVTMAGYILAHTPPDVLRRAGVEAQS